MYYFNSHPHEEDDFYAACIDVRCAYFNSHPHEEDDGSIKFLWIVGLYFNSHPHEEDDKKVTGEVSRYYISTHILTKRMTPRHLSQLSSVAFQLTSSRRG